MRNNAPVTSRILTAIVATFHLVIGLGIGWNVGPVEYDPAAFIVAGQPGKWQPGGLEILFPRILGCLYVSIATGLLFAALIINTKDSIRSSLVVALCYHFGAATDAMNLFREDTGAINADKLDPMEPIYGHSLLFTLSLISFVLAGSVGNDKSQTIKVD